MKNLEARQIVLITGSKQTQTFGKQVKKLPNPLVSFRSCCTPLIASRRTSPGDGNLAASIIGRHLLIFLTLLPPRPHGVFSQLEQIGRASCRERV